MLVFGAVAGNAHGGPVFGASFPGMGSRIDRNWGNVGEEGGAREPGTLAPDPLAPSRRFPAFGKTHPIPVASRSRGRLVFLWLPLPASQQPRIFHKISSPPCPGSPVSPLLRPLLAGGEGYRLNSGDVTSFDMEEPWNFISSQCNSHYSSVLSIITPRRY